MNGGYAEMLRTVAVRRANAEALVFPGERLTYGDLVPRGELHALGDRVGLVLPNSPELVELLVGAAMIGAPGLADAADPFALSSALFVSLDPAGLPTEGGDRR
jgi:acyl-coenzyme A synthetase/AMP-(fatty) acid ligase